MNQLTLLPTREVPPLESYSPFFTMEECLLVYKNDTVQVGGGFKDLDFDRDNIKYVDRHSIVVRGYKIEGKKDYYQGPRLKIVVALANEFLLDKTNKTKAPEVFDYFNEFGEDLSCSIRYWLAVNKKKEIDELILEIERRQRCLKQLEILLAVDTLEVHNGATFQKEEREMILKEFDFNAADLF
jgi:hypothetical protein